MGRLVLVERDLAGQLERRADLCRARAFNGHACRFDLLSRHRDGALVLLEGEADWTLSRLEADRPLEQVRLLDGLGTHEDAALDRNGDLFRILSRAFQQDGHLVRGDLHRLASVRHPRLDAWRSAFLGKQQLNGKTLLHTEHTGVHA